MKKIGATPILACETRALPVQIKLKVAGSTVCNALARRTGFGSGKSMLANRNERGINPSSRRSESERRARFGPRDSRRLSRQCKQPPDKQCLQIIIFLSGSARVPRAGVGVAPTILGSHKPARFSINQFQPSAQRGQCFLSPIRGKRKS
jgi:hypothetical protein